MIFLEIPFFRHYVFAVVQTSSSPTHPGGNPPSIRYARARQQSDGSDGGTLPCTLHPNTLNLRVIFSVNVLYYYAYHGHGHT